MFSFDPFIEKALEKIKDAGLAPVYLEQVTLLEAHLGFLSERLAAAEKELAKAEVKLERQAQELESLHSQISAFDSKAKCVEIGPCLIKENASGIRMEGIYCPHCQSLMERGQYRAYNSAWVYMCCKCHYELPAEAVESALASFRS